MQNQGAEADKMEAELAAATKSGDVAALEAACAKMHGAGSLKEHLSPSIVSAAEAALEKARQSGIYDCKIMETAAAAPLPQRTRSRRHREQAAEGGGASPSSSSQQDASYPGMMNPEQATLYSDNNKQ